MARYLVTGAAGFIGSHLTRRLLELGHEVLGYDNAWPADTGEPGAPSPLVRLDGNVSDYPALAEAVKNVDYVLHHAALVSLQSSFAQPLKTFADNAAGTANVLEAARASARLRRVVLACSSAVDTVHATDDLASPYALTKFINEYWGKLYASNAYRVPVTMLRYYNVFGPGQSAAGAYAAVIPAFMKAAVSGIAPTIYGDGAQTRDFIYVDNVVQANIAACTREAAAGRILPIGSGQSWSVNRLWEAIARMAPSLLPEQSPPPVAPVYAAARAGEILHSVADIRASVSALEDYRRVSVVEGLSRTLAFHARRGPCGAEREADAMSGRHRSTGARF